MRLRILCASLLCAGLYGQNQRTAPPPSVLEKLYRLVWPAGRFDGDLVRTVSKNTQKGASNPDCPPLYLVHTNGGAVTEWKSAAGAIEVVVCAGDETLYYRRGRKVMAEALRVHGASVVESAGEAVELSTPVISSLVACTAEDGKSLLWTQSANGNLLRMTRKGASLIQAPSIADAEFSAIPGRELADYLRIIRCMRPDGFTATVLNDALVGEKSGQDRFLIVDSNAVQFSGIPAWIAGTDAVFVVGARAAAGPQ